MGTASGAFPVTCETCEYRRQWPTGEQATRDVLDHRARHPGHVPRVELRSDQAPLVLIVDDVQDQRHMYTTYLVMHGFRVETAADGEQALGLALTFRPDVIVMDLSLPHLDGWETTRRLKHNPSTAGIPVIALTGQVQNRSVERAREAGCDAYVVKPCLPKDLVAKLHRVLAHPPKRG